MTRILVVESNLRALEDLTGILPETVHWVGADDALDAEEAFAEDGPFDTIIVQGAMQDGVSSGQVSTTLEFLRKISAEHPEITNVIVVSGMFDSEPYSAQYKAAFPGCHVLNKTAVLNRTVALPV